MSWYEKLLGAPFEAIAVYFTRRAELKQARFEAQLKMEQARGERQAQLILAGLAADANWEMEFARQAQNSWKDEYTLGVVSLPAILAFVKTSWLNGPKIVSEGFASLSLTPWWFQTILGIMFCATVGVRWWRRTQYDTDSTPDGATRPPSSSGGVSSAP